MRVPLRATVCGEHHQKFGAKTRKNFGAKEWKRGRITRRRGRTATSAAEWKPRRTHYTADEEADREEPDSEKRWE